MMEELTRGVENLVGRFYGPMSLRLIIQPAVATFMAVRAGLRDARQGNPPFLWTFASDAGRRRELLLQGWKDVGSVFLVALLLDSIYQLIEHSGIYTLELVLTATTLALVPYVVLRGLVTRIARRFGTSSKTPYRKNP